MNCCARLARLTPACPTNPLTRSFPCRRFHLEKTRQQLAPHQIANPVAQRLRRGKLKNNPLVSDQRKGDAGMSDRLEIELVLNVPRFSFSERRNFRRAGRL